jgi:hypothetical protein
MEQPVRYDHEIVDVYATMMGDAVADPATSALLDLLGDISGLRVLDLPCGEGRARRRAGHYMWRPAERFDEALLFLRLDRGRLVCRPGPIDS